ncbi:phage major tail protein, TP901-1 family [Sporolactobacillus nakayamae]|uniref:Phage major tail protein, TP901-1 family n=1 Tax=Sporolactobacillus nakayamae TaxID=269670 RepID=A0A1I2P9N6_9BACL|nr:phage major tail protein, TP901-1 family [Sporolactobacillus nakayamae]SFG10667.1 phage major tail protein, TP901-1 family [Sporolactobacillus nakayamae]
MAKVKGVNCKLYVVDSDPENPTILAGQRNATLNRSTDTIETTAKDSEGGWKENEAAFKEWSIDADGLLVESDAAYDTLEEKFNNSEKVDVVIIMQNGSKYKGKAVLNDFPIEMPYDDMATYSSSFTGDGPLTKTPAV